MSVIVCNRTRCLQWPTESTSRRTSIVLLLLEVRHVLSIRERFQTTQFTHYLVILIYSNLVCLHAYVGLFMFQCSIHTHIGRGDMIFVGSLYRLTANSFIRSAGICVVNGQIYFWHANSFICLTCSCVHLSPSSAPTDETVKSNKIVD